MCVKATTCSLLNYKQMQSATEQRVMTVPMLQIINFMLEKEFKVNKREKRNPTLCSHPTFCNYLFHHSSTIPNCGLLKRESKDLKNKYRHKRNAPFPSTRQTYQHHIIVACARQPSLSNPPNEETTTFSISEDFCRL